MSPECSYSLKCVIEIILIGGSEYENSYGLLTLVTPRSVSLKHSGLFGLFTAHSAYESISEAHMAQIHLKSMKFWI